MDTIYGAGLDPTPFITLAYGLGALGLFGYAANLVRERLKLRHLAKAVSRTPQKPAKGPQY